MVTSSVATTREYTPARGNPVRWANQCDTPCNEVPNSRPAKTSNTILPVTINKSATAKINASNKTEIKKRSPLNTLPMSTIPRKPETRNTAHCHCNNRA